MRVSALAFGRVERLAVGLFDGLFGVRLAMAFGHGRSSGRARSSASGEAVAPGRVSSLRVKRFVLALALGACAPTPPTRTPDRAIDDGIEVRLGCIVIMRSEVDEAMRA